jgi:hypothetical protein
MTDAELASAYFEALDRLQALRAAGAPAAEIAAASGREREAWDRVRERWPDAVCR